MAEIPDYQTLMMPVLRAAVRGETRVPLVIDEVAQEIGLTDDQLAKELPSGGQTLMTNRTHWACTYLMKAGLLERVRRGVFRATERGRQVLQDHPARVDNKVLSQFPEFIAFLGKRNGDTPKAGTIIPSSETAKNFPREPNASAPMQTEDGLQTSAPDEQIDKAIRKLNWHSAKSSLTASSQSNPFPVEHYSSNAWF